MAENTLESGGRIFVLEPDGKLASKITSALSEAAPSAKVEVARSLEEAQQMVLHIKPDIFVLDVDATYDLGQEFLLDLRTSHPNARAIILTAIHLAAHREQAAGLGAIHFLEKPFPHADFVDLVQTLLQPSGKPGAEKFQGTLSDLHIADIIQLKCMAGSTAALEFTGPRDQKARVFFENGQVRHATAPGLEGISAFNEIVHWKGGRISEVSGVTDIPRSIDLDWQVLLLEAMRKLDETRADGPGAVSRRAAQAAGGRKVLVIDDSVMLLNFVEEILTETNYRVVTAATAEEGLRLSESEPPDLILLDYVLPDIRGDEVCRRLLENPVTKKIPVLFMSGFGTDFKPEQLASPNVVGFLSKPFSSEKLIKTIAEQLPKTEEADMEISSEEEPGEVTREADGSEEPAEEVSSGVSSESFASKTEEVEAIASAVGRGLEESAKPGDDWREPDFGAADEDLTISVPEGGAFFSGDTSFFSLNRALQTISKEKLTGTLRLFWKKEPVELLAQDGRILLVTTRDPDLYCPEAPITLANVDAEKAAEARTEQRETGCPLFLTLAHDGLILREPALQLVQHHGQKLFAQLWTARRVKFLFEQLDELPEFACEVAGEEDVDQWALNTLRFVQYDELDEAHPVDPTCIPAYTRDGFARVQNLRLTVAEAQFGSQFNGNRSVQQIAKNLRLDVKFARLTLFRFLGLELVECWPASAAVRQEKRGFFARLTGLGD